MNDNEKKNIFIGIIIIIIFILVFKGIGSNNNYSSSLPQDPKDMNNKQLQQYLDWNDKQNKIEDEKQKAFK